MPSKAFISEVTRRDIRLFGEMAQQDMAKNQYVITSRSLRWCMRHDKRVWVAGKLAKICAALLRLKVWSFVPVCGNGAEFIQTVSERKIRDEWNFVQLSLSLLVTSTRRGGRKRTAREDFGRNLSANLSVSLTTSRRTRLCASALNFFWSDYNSSETLTFYSLAAEGCFLEGGYTPAEHFHLGKFRSQADNFPRSLWMGSWVDFYASSCVTSD